MFVRTLFKISVSGFVKTLVRIHVKILLKSLLKSSYAAGTCTSRTLKRSSFLALGGTKIDKNMQSAGTELIV
jgi:hypothetical protein